MFIDDLLHEVEKSGMGIDIHGIKIGALAYADDIVLLASTLEEADALLHLVSDYARKWQFEYNHKKCGVVIYAHSAEDRRTACEHAWMLCDAPIKIVDEYKYLGLEMGLTNTRRWNSLLKRYTSKACSKAAILHARGCHRAGLRPRSCVAMYKATISPTYEFGMELWCASDAQMEELQKVQDKFGHTVLGLNNYASNTFVRTELDMLSVKARKDEMILRWWWRAQHIMNNQQHRPIAHVLQCRWKRAVNSELMRVPTVGESENKMHMSVLLNVRDTLRRYGMHQEWLNGIPDTTTKQEWSARVLATIQAVELNDRQEDMLKHQSLCAYMYTEQATSVGRGVAAYLDDVYNRDAVQIRIQIRAGSLGVLENIGRHHRPQWNERRRCCRMCGTRCKETIPHFLLSAPSTIRTERNLWIVLPLAWTETRINAHRNMDGKL